MSFSAATHYLSSVGFPSLFFTCQNILCMFYDTGLFLNRTTSGQQCCYDETGDIIVGQDSGGTIDFIAPRDTKTTIGHFFVDVLPHLFCCTPVLLANCERYYEFRPSDDCSRTRPQRPGEQLGGMWQFKSYI